MLWILIFHMREIHEQRGISEGFMQSWVINCGTWCCSVHSSEEAIYFFKQKLQMKKAIKIVWVWTKGKLLRFIFQQIRWSTLLEIDTSLTNKKNTNSNWINSLTVCAIVESFNLIGGVLLIEAIEIKESIL